MLKLLLVATPIGTLQSGQVGGVGINLGNIARELTARGYHLQILAPASSEVPDLPIKAIATNGAP